MDNLHFLNAQTRQSTLHLATQQFVERSLDDVPTISKQLFTLPQTDGPIRKAFFPPYLSRVLIRY